MDDLRNELELLCQIGNPLKQEADVKVRKLEITIGYKCINEITIMEEVCKGLESSTLSDS